MKLTYRGVQYTEAQAEPKRPIVDNREVIYRGNSSKARIAPKFPWIKYIQQLFRHSDSKPVFDPITFWYEHKREFVEDCWLLDDVEQLNFCWKLTLHLERTKALEQHQKSKKTQLKYRGVTYYR